MTRKHVLFATSVLLVLIAAAGCAPRYMITQPLTQPLVVGETVRVGEILDEMPAETEEGDRPTAENLDKFRHYLVDELSKRGDLHLEALSDDAADPSNPSTKTPRYEVTGSVLGYKAGSGFLRFMVGFGAGSAKMLTHLELTDKTSDEIIFSGNFEGTVKSWAESGSEMFRRVARDFTKELEKQFKSPGDIGGQKAAKDSSQDDYMP